jgi:hypothetical protein
VPAQAPTAGFPKRWPLVTTSQNRGETPTKDARLINAFVEKDLLTGEYWVEKRPGLSTPLYTNLDGGTYSGQGRGIYLWNQSGVTTTYIYEPPPAPRRHVAVTTPFGAQFLIMVAGTTTYKVVLTGGVPVKSTLGTVALGTRMRFAQIGNVATPLLVYGDGSTKPYYTDGTTQFQVSDVNFPAGTVPGFAYLDGTLYVMDINGNIFGSKNLNDPTAWDPLNKIVAQIEADGGVCIAKQLVYVIALKQWTTEFFYDAGNTTGSPLASIPGAVLNLGCSSADTVQNLDDKLFWVTATRYGAPQVVMLVNLVPTIVSTPAVDRLLEGNIPANYNTFIFKDHGHQYYVITLLTSGVTMTLDVGERMWYIWSDPSLGAWNLLDSTLDLTGVNLVQDKANGFVYVVDGSETYPSDNGTVFPVDIYTPNFDAGIDRTKMLSMMRFNADQVTGSTLQVRHSDDDYQTWDNFKTVDLGQPRPILTNEGSFHRRAYHFRHFANTSFRIKSVDLQMDLGTL